MLNQIEQVHVALGGWFPNINTSGGWEVESSPFSTKLSNAAEGWVFGLTGNWNVWDSGVTYGQVKQQRALLSESKITYDDDVRQVELEIQQAASNLLQNRELIQSTEKNVELAEEAVRLAKARLDAGAGTQLDVLNAQVQLTTAQSTRLQALFGWTSSLAEFDRVIGAQSTYTESFAGIAPRATKTAALLHRQRCRCDWKAETQPISPRQGNSEVSRASLQVAWFGEERLDRNPVGGGILLAIGLKCHVALARVKNRSS